MRIRQSYNLNSMSQLGFKSVLARIKEDFHAKFVLLKRSHLTIEQTAQLLYKYLNGDPMAIRETLLRSTGKNELVWDDLLLFLQQQLAVIQAVKKIEYSPLSATEIIDRHTNEFGKLIAYVKTRETNTMQSLHHVPVQILGEDIIAVCFDKQLLFYDCHHSAIICSLHFRYTHVRGKLLEKEQQRKIQKLQQSEKINIEMSDQVQEIINIKGSQRPVHFLTSNMKNSVRGSEKSSEKSNDKMFFRRNTESLERRKVKSNVTKIKNDDVQRVFQFFEQSSLENSINIAHAFVHARQTFQKSIVLENSFLDKEAKERNFDLSSAKFHKNYQRELVEMKKTNKQLSGVRANLSLSMKSRHQLSSFHPRHHDRQNMYFKTKKEEPIDPLEMNNKQLEIISLCLYENYLLVSLFNREIRLFKLKRALSRVSEELVFEKCFREVITFVWLYRSQNTVAFHVVIGFQKDNQSQIIVYHLDDQMKLKEKVFEQEFPFSAKHHSVMPLGVALFSELGYFAVVELNSCLAGSEQRLAWSTQLFNPQTNYRVSINQVRINKKQSSLFISCSGGYVYLYDRYIKAIKYQTKICQSPILDLCLFHADEELLVLYGNGNMAILSTFHLEKVYLYQSYGQISNESKIFKGVGDSFYVYTSRGITPYSLGENEEKRFNNIKSAKILRSRVKLKSKERRGAEKARVLRVVEGRGGEEDFLAVILEKGEILVFNAALEYVGSYFYFKVGHIIEVYSNKCHQFLAIVLDNNTIEVVNLYTQNLIFTVKTAENDPPPKINVRSDSSLYSSAIGNKIRPKKISSGVSLVHFMDVEISNCFLSVISKSGKVSHYNEKGVLLNCINLEDRLGDSVQGAMVYEDEELVIASDCNILILYRKSYNRKGVIRVGPVPITKIRKCKAMPFSLCVLDCEGGVYLVSAYSKEVRRLCEGRGVSRYEHLLFNEHCLLRLCEQKGTVLQFPESQSSFPCDHEKHLFTLMGACILQINRLTCKASRFSFPLSDFEQFPF